MLYLQWKLLQIYFPEFSPNENTLMVIDLPFKIALFG